MPAIVLVGGLIVLGGVTSLLVWLFWER